MKKEELVLEYYHRAIVQQITVTMATIGLIWTLVSAKVLDNSIGVKTGVGMFMATLFFLMLAQSGMIDQAGGIKPSFGVTVRRIYMTAWILFILGTTTLGITVLFLNH